MNSDSLFADWKKTAMEANKNGSGYVSWIADDPFKHACPSITVNRENIGTGITVMLDGVPFGLLYIFVPDKA